MAPAERPAVSFREGIVRAECGVKRYEAWYDDRLIGTYASARAAVNAYAREYERAHAR